MRKMIKAHADALGVKYAKNIKTEQLLAIMLAHAVSDRVHLADARSNERALATRLDTTVEELYATARTAKLRSYQLGEIEKMLDTDMAVESVKDMDRMLVDQLAEITELVGKLKKSDDDNKVLRGTVHLLSR